MVKLLIKTVWREIRKSLPRYLALVAIFALGLGFYAGLGVTTYDMRHTMDHHFDARHFQDLRLISTYGFSEPELEAIRAKEGVERAEGFITRDAELEAGGESFNVKMLSLAEQVDLPEVTEGRLPQNAGECLMDHGTLGKDAPAIGETLTLSGEGSERQSFEVVGYAATPAYLSFQRGSSTVGDGEIDFFIIVPREAFPEPLYTEVCLTVEGAAALDCYGEEYDALIREMKGRLEDPTLKARQLERVRATLPQTAQQGVAEPEWYILDRGTNVGAESFHQDVQRIGKIAQVFPLLFFLVAALVCMTTMTRMVDEQRTQMGTFKALGFGKGFIAAQLLLYALSACLIGGVIGISAGFIVFPSVIWKVYEIMYQLPALQCVYHLGYFGLALGMGAALSGGVTLITALRCLRESAAQLMRPVAPKSGKKVLLERLPFLWKRMNFTSKVTARNLLRYKKRFFMTVLGIGGCTALLVTGFGLRDSILGIVPTQYGEIYRYDLGITLAADTPEARAAVEAETDAVLYYGQVNLTAEGEGGSPLDCYAMIPADTQMLYKMVTLRTRVGQDSLSLPEEGAVISEKLATRFSLKVGDTISLKKSDTERGKMVIAGITEQYVGSYVYCTPAYYESVFGELPPFINCMATTESDELGISERLLTREDISAVTRVQDMLENFNKIFDSLNFVVYVLIVSASLLAFIVLYNLTNINITERNRELATIKVLGFFDREVDAYLYRENIILTLIGCGFGLILGVFLHRFVIVTAEVDMVMFTRTVKPLSFGISAALTFVFAAFVNFVMHFRLKKVDMTESLKSVE